MVIKSILAAVSFLTIIPSSHHTKNNNLEDIAKDMHFFPVIGLLVGLVIVPIAIPSALYIENHYLSALIIAISLSLVTGLHHSDALADYADGIMAKGDRERKYHAMHAPNIGSAGVFAISIYLLGMVISIASYKNIDKLIIALLLSEIVSKYSMVLQAYWFNSAWDGLSSLFTKSMKSKKKMIISTIITVILINIISYSNTMWIVVFFIGTICPFIIGYIAKRNFGGISGDVIGATNEITRLCSLIGLSI